MGPDRKEVGLDCDQPEFGFAVPGFSDGEPELSVEFVHVAIGGDSRVVFGPTPAAK